MFQASAQVNSKSVKNNLLFYFYFYSGGAIWLSWIRIPDPGARIQLLKTYSM